VTAAASRFQRYLLPGLAFKSAVIGGGYATGRELAEFFLPSGPWGGLAAMVLSMLIWSVICILTFLLARAIRANDYRTFFRHLLGRGWWTFEVAYLALIVVVLAAFGAAAGELAATMFGWPRIVGTLVLVAIITGVVQAGTTAVERMFKLMSAFMYLVYAIAACLILYRFGGGAMAQLSNTHELGQDWVLNGVTYAGYNMFAAVSILLVVRHLLCRRDAVIAGALAGPLAIPAGHRRRAPALGPDARPARPAVVPVVVPADDHGRAGRNRSHADGLGGRPHQRQLERAHRRCPRPRHAGGDHCRHSADGRIPGRWHRTGRADREGLPAAGLRHPGHLRGAFADVLGVADLDAPWAGLHRARR